MVIGHKLVVSLRAFPVEKIETSTDIIMGLMETVMAYVGLYWSCVWN